MQFLIAQNQFALDRGIGLVVFGADCIILSLCTGYLKIMQHLMIFD